jgi:hypothetical protein
LTLDDIRRLLAIQHFRIFRDERTGDHIITDWDYHEIARQPASEAVLRATVIVALDNAGFVWPGPF